MAETVIGIVHEPVSPDSPLLQTSKSILDCILFWNRDHQMLRWSIPRPTQWSHPRHCAWNASSKPFHGPGMSTSKKTFRPYSLRKYFAKHRSQLELLSRGVPGALALFLFLHIETTYFYAYDLTYGISMLPTINATGDSVIISKLYRRGKSVQIGDVVSFEHPVDQGVYSIKRVIGLEGDWVCRDTPGVGQGTMIQVCHSSVAFVRKD